MFLLPNILVVTFQKKRKRKKLASSQSNAAVVLFKVIVSSSFSMPVVGERTSSLRVCLSCIVQIQVDESFASSGQMNSICFDLNTSFQSI